MSTNKLFKKVLIANRGEIACRIIRTLNRLDIEAVAVYSDADRYAQHVLQADEAYWIGPSPAAESYLSMDRLLDVAKRAGVDAIHPGYGFLSENASFAQRCVEHNIVLIGPPASAMVAMGSKSQAKHLMQDASVPLVPGYHGDTQDSAFLKQQAGDIGYPVLLKASMGGGGKGMRIVESESDFDTALSACKREAQSSFGDDHILIEKYINQPRHVEIQVFADQYGNVVYMSERDCSIQRRHQKVIEEAPAPGLDPATRSRMGEAAVRAAKAIGYVGAGTIEFLLASSGDFYFMEMNTRLQVEHPVTEMITGQDLVEWQVRVAEGNPLLLKQDQIEIDGHAIEVRIYAEDTSKDFLPSTGVIHYLRMPDQSEHLRLDSGVIQGDEISVFYDPMIAKLIVWDKNRDQAIHRMQRALRQFNLFGLKTNISFLGSLVAHDAFCAGTLSTHFIEDHQSELAFDSPPNSDADYVLAGIYLALKDKSTELSDEPWQVLKGWHVNGAVTQQFCFMSNDGEQVKVDLTFYDDDIVANCSELSLTLQCRLEGGRLAVTGGLSLTLTVISTDDGVVLFKDSGDSHVQLYRYSPVSVVDPQSEKHLRAPMNGRVVHVTVSDGDRVHAGDLLVTVEAMKMEHGIRAQKTGFVKAIFFNEGELVNEGDELIELELEQEED